MLSDICQLYTSAFIVDQDRSSRTDAQVHDLAKASHVELRNAIALHFIAGHREAIGGTYAGKESIET